MERVWAPWRMTYILGEKSDRCFLCDGAAPGDDRDRLVLHRGSKCLIILNRFPYNDGHLMVAPLRHVGNLEDLDDDETSDLMRSLQLSLTVMRKVITPQGFNIGFNIGQVAGAGIVDHIHLHVVPRWSGDTNFMPVLADTKIVNEDLVRTYDRLKSGFPS